MYNVFIDTNIIFEHALQRKNYNLSLEIFKLAEDNRIDCFASSASFYTLAYFLEKERNAKEILKKYLQILHPLPADKQILERALSSSFKDIEDAFQYYTALQSCNYFVTFNMKDFTHHQLHQLPVIHPADFLKTILS